jgi:hypothetical protein
MQTNKEGVFEVPLRRYVEGGIRRHGQLFEFAPSHLRSLYVIRELVLCEVHNTFDDIGVEAKRERFIALFQELAAKGVKLPNFYVVGGKRGQPSDLHVVTEKVSPVEYTDVPKNKLAADCHTAITAMASYLTDTHMTGQPVLFDVFKLGQFVYGTATAAPQPDFYMVDFDGYIAPTATDLGYNVYAEDICRIAEQLEARTGVEGLLVHAVDSLPGTDYMLT